jgi:hypothetical protein
MHFQIGQQNVLKYMLINYNYRIKFCEYNQSFQSFTMLTL